MGVVWRVASFLLWAAGMRWVLLVMLGVLCGGCAAGQRPAVASPVEKWIARHGGLLGGDEQQRAADVARPLIRSLNQPIQVRVLASPTVTAYAWPNGQVYVTRGLLKALDDEELAAAIAHELGHLLDHGHLRSAVALQGCREAPDTEIQADLLGCQLLENSGHSQRAMVRMLHKVHARTPACAANLRHRIERLSARLPGG